MIWIFVLTPGVPLWKCVDVGSSDTITSIIFLCNGKETEICIMKTYRFLFLAQQPPMGPGPPHLRGL